MSLFGGRMKEYERISLDRFDGRNLQSTVYFLSHLHEDHTAGLAQPLLYKRLTTNKNMLLYCSEVTEVLLCASKKYRHLAPFIKSIPINTPTTIDVPDPLFEERETVTVTLLPAFHCPGSVMCLFEGHEGNVIYTGDFRWEHFDIEHMHYLRTGERVKEIKSLYVDTTFCTPANLYIPSRQQCIDAVYHLVHEWTAQGPDYAVYIYLRAQYGHEPLINSLAVRLNKKIHVTEHKAAVYENIEEFHNNFTSDGSATQIHACSKMCTVEIDGEKVPCRQQYSDDKVLAILPTTMYFTQFQHLTLDKVIRRISDNFYRACYSFHSSYTEIKDLLSYLKPKHVYPNVKPPTDDTIAMTQHRLNSMLTECLKSDGGGDTETDEIEVKQLGNLKTRSKGKTNKRKQKVSTSDSESLDFGTPSKKLKQKEELPLSEPVVNTRRSSRRLVVSKNSMDSKQKTPVKSEKSPNKRTPVKSERSDVSVHSSYAGSHHGSEIDLTHCLDSQSSLSLDQSKEDMPECSWSQGSFLSAVNSSSLEDDSCVLIEEDTEQTDESYEDKPIIIEDESDPDIIEAEETVINIDEVDGVESSQSKTGPKSRKRKKGKAKGGSAKVANQTKTDNVQKELDSSANTAYTNEESIKGISESELNDKAGTSATKEHAKETVEGNSDVLTFEKNEESLICDNASSVKNIESKAEEAIIEYATESVVDDLHDTTIGNIDESLICGNDSSITETDSKAVESKLKHAKEKIDNLQEEKDSYVNTAHTNNGESISEFELYDTAGTSATKEHAKDNVDGDYNVMTVKNSDESLDDNLLCTPIETFGESLKCENAVTLMNIESEAVKASIKHATENVDDDSNVTTADKIDEAHCTENASTIGNTDSKALKAKAYDQMKGMDNVNSENKAACLTISTAGDVNDDPRTEDNIKGVEKIIVQSNQNSLSKESEGIQVKSNDDEINPNNVNNAISKKDDADVSLSGSEVIMIDDEEEVEILEEERLESVMASSPLTFDIDNDFLVLDELDESVNEDENDESLSQNGDCDKDDSIECGKKEDIMEKEVDIYDNLNEIDEIIKENSETKNTSVDTGLYLDDIEMQTNDASDSSMMLSKKTGESFKDSEESKEVSNRKTKKGIVTVKKMRFTRSRSFDMLDELEDNSEFGFKNEVNEKDLPDSSIYFGKLAYCFETPIKKDVLKEEESKTSKPNEKKDGIAGDDQKPTTIKSLNEDEKDVIDLTGDDEICAVGYKELKIDANVNFKSEGGKKLMSISFSKSIKKEKSIKKSVVDEIVPKSNKCDTKEESNTACLAEKGVISSKTEEDSNIGNDIGLDEGEKKTSEIQDNINTDDINEKNVDPNLQKVDEASKETVEKLDLELKIPEEKDENTNIETADINAEDVKKKEKEADERAEVKRQALGFMMETDSDTDSDSTQEPGSPTGSVLYEEYIELSSGNEEITNDTGKWDTGTRTNTVEKDAFIGDDEVTDHDSVTGKGDNMHGGNYTDAKDKDEYRNQSDRDRRSSKEDREKDVRNENDHGWLSTKNRKYRTNSDRRKSSSDDDDYHTRDRRYKSKSERRRMYEHRNRDKPYRKEDSISHYKRTINVQIKDRKHSGKSSHSNSNASWNSAPQPYSSQSDWNQRPGPTGTAMGSFPGTSMPPFMPPGYGFPPTIPFGFPPMYNGPPPLSYPPFIGYPPAGGLPPPLGVPPPVGVPQPTGVPPPTGIPPPTSIPPPTGVPPPKGVPTSTEVPPTTSLPKSTGSTLSTKATVSTTSLFAKLSTPKSTSSSLSLNSALAAVQSTGFGLTSLPTTFNKDITELKSKIFQVTGLTDILKSNQPVTESQQQVSYQPVQAQQTAQTSDKMEDLPTLMKKLGDIQKQLEISQKETIKQETSIHQRDEHYDDLREYPRRRDSYEERRGVDSDRYDDYKQYEDVGRIDDSRRYRRHEDERYKDRWEDERRHYVDRASSSRSSYDDPYEGIPPPDPSDPYYEEWMEYYRERRQQKERTENVSKRPLRYEAPPPGRSFTKSAYSEPPDDYSIPTAYRGRPPPMTGLFRGRVRPPSQVRSNQGHDHQFSNVRGYGHTVHNTRPPRGHHNTRPYRGRFPTAYQSQNSAEYSDDFSTHSSETQSFVPSNRGHNAAPQLRVLSRSGKVSISNDSSLFGGHGSHSSDRPFPRKDDLPVFLTGIQHYQPPS